MRKETKFKSKKLFSVVLLVTFLLSGPIFADAFYRGYYGYFYSKYASCGESGRRVDCKCSTWTGWQDWGCGKGDCQADQIYQVRTRDCGPCRCGSEQETRCVADLACRPEPKNDPVSGTIFVNSTSVCVGEPIIVSIAGQDNDGLYKLSLKYKNRWYYQNVSGESTARTWTFTENMPGVYNFCGQVTGHIASSTPSYFFWIKNKETVETSPYCVSVVVSCPPCSGSPVRPDNDWCGGADVDRDGKVDLKDLVELSRGLGRSGCFATNNWCDRLDINKNGKVEQSDVNILSGYYNRTDCSGR